MAMKVFAFGFKDIENTLPPRVVEILHDVTFARVIVESVGLWVRVDNSALRLNTGVVEFSFDDWAGDAFSDKISLEVPMISLACVEKAKEPPMRQNLIPSDASAGQKKLQTHAYFSTSVSVVTHGRKRDFIEARNFQQRHVQNHDLRTNRATFLLQKGFSNSRDTSLYTEDVREAPSMSIPSMPPPLHGESITL